MRVIAGRWRGRALKCVNLRDLRPLTDRVKKTIFDVLGARVEDAVVSDLFAGCGSFGIEALSRGAKSVTFVEISQQALKIIAENLQRFQSQESYELVREDAYRFLKFAAQKGHQYDLIFVDPPYRLPQTDKFFHFFSTHLILKKDGILVYRHYRRETFSHIPAPLVLDQQKRFGETTVSFFSVEDDNENCHLSGDI